MTYFIIFGCIFSGIVCLCTALFFFNKTNTASTNQRLCYTVAMCFSALSALFFTLALALADAEVVLQLKR